MRVSENMRLSSALLAQSSLSARFEKATAIASSGQRVTMPSDDPVAYSSKVRIDNALTLIDKRSQLATSVSGELDVAQSALSTGVDLLARAREIAVQGSNDTLDANARTILGQEISSLREEMMAVGNTRYGTKYLFAGSKTNQAPFDPTGAFVGNDTVMRVPVMDGVAPEANISGAKTFTATGGRDILGDLQTLATALAANDVTTVRSSIDSIDASHTQLVRGQTEAGLASERFTSAIDVLSNTKTVVSEARAAQVEGDPMANLTELSQAQTAYQRGVEITKQLLALPSLVQ